MATPKSPTPPPPRSGSPGEFEAVTDVARNRARTRFSGSFDAAAMQAAADRVEALLPSLRPGFSLLADFSAVTAMELECVPHLTHIMDLCRERKIGFIVRILPERKRDIGINLLAVVHYRGRVKTVTADTLAEAERALG